MKSVAVSTEHLPAELRQMVRRVSVSLGKVIEEYEGKKFLARIEAYQDLLKKTRAHKDRRELQAILTKLKRETKSNQMKIAHAFSVQLELINVCEAAYRTWRQRSKSVPEPAKSKLHLTFVLTAHPTEARSKAIVDILNALGTIVGADYQSDFLFNEDELLSNLRLLWLQPLSKTEKPTVVDEANYIFPLVFSDELFDFILSDKPNYEVRLRSWVGGDKDGHPYVNRIVMRECFERSRRSLIKILQSKLDLIVTDTQVLQKSGDISKLEINKLVRLRNELSKFREISKNDGTRLSNWVEKFQAFLKTATPFVKKHHQTNLIHRLIEIFPAFVFPIELREDSEMIAEAVTDKKAAIREMLEELERISGNIPITCYAKALVISHCETTADISAAVQLIKVATRNSNLPVIPLFETRNSLETCKQILSNWLKVPANRSMVRKHWSGTFEVMLGYSDSAKEVGSLSSRYLIAGAMWDIEQTIRSFKVEPRIFHGSGGSVERGGGSMKEQIAWWSNGAIAQPKMTIQGEMIQRQFATKEILNSLCTHMATEAHQRKSRSLRPEKNAEMSTFVNEVANSYRSLVDDPKVLLQLLDATPFRYLDILQIGSRPSRRSEAAVSTASLRAIPWVLCWTQTRILLPTWWGLGTAWQNQSPAAKKKMVALFKSSPFFSSFVKTLSFTLAKVELDIWELYFGKNRDEALVAKVRREYRDAVRLVLEVSQQKDLMWHRPWLGESIRLRSSNIHILNLLQIIALDEDNESLLKESLVGIASGMLTTG